MKTLKTAAVLIALALTVASCSSKQSENQESTENTSIENTTENNSSTKVDILEADAKRMGELACQSRANFDKWKANEITREQMEELNAPLNVEMQEINVRFEGEYTADVEKVKRFQDIFQGIFQTCAPASQQ
jgi:PBP1b-binding outer membrane lipoprotein LpoB